MNVQTIITPSGNLSSRTRKSHYEKSEETNRIKARFELMKPRDYMKCGFRQDTR